MIFEEDDTVSIELHIIVDAGVNLTAVSSSIMSEVRYAVGNMTGSQVRAVDVYVDSMEIGLRGERRGTMVQSVDGKTLAAMLVHASRFPKRGKAEDQ